MGMSREQFIRAAPRALTPSRALEAGFFGIRQLPARERQAGWAQSIGSGHFPGQIPQLPVRCHVIFDAFKSSQWRMHLLRLVVESQGDFWTVASRMLALLPATLLQELTMAQWLLLRHLQIVVRWHAATAERHPPWERWLSQRHQQQRLRRLQLLLHVEFHAAIPWLCHRSRGR